jgi:hypothetical protein
MEFKISTALKTCYSLLSYNTTETGKRAPLLDRNIWPASNNMANSQFVNARNAMRLNMFLFHYSFTKTSKEGGWW